MARKVGQLVIDVAANVAKATSDIAKIEQRVGKFGQKVDKDMAKLKKVLGGVFAGFTAQAAVSGLARMFDEITRTADEMAKFGSRIGISAEELSKLQFAAERSGVGVSTLNMALQRMTRRVAEAAAGTGEAKDAIKQLGIDARQISSQSPEKQFRAIADALQGVTSQSERVRLAFKLFDSEGVALLQMLRDGSAGLNNYAAQLQNLGGVVTNDFAKKSEEARDAITDFNLAVQGLQMSLANELAPELTLVIGKLTEMIALVNKHPKVFEYLKKAAVWALTGGAVSPSTISAAMDDLDRKLEQQRKQRAELERMSGAAASIVGDIRGTQPAQRAAKTDAQSAAKKELDATVRVYEEILNSQTMTKEKLAGLWSGYTAARLKQIDTEAAAMRKAGVDADLVAQMTQVRTQQMYDALAEISKRTSFMESFYGQIGDTGLGKDMTKSFRTEADKWKSIADDASQSISDSMGSAFSGMIQGSQSAGDAFRAMAVSIIADLVRIAAQETIVKTITSAVGGLFSFAGFGHSGGFVGPSGVQKFHSGGFPGLQQNEVPIIAKKGEVIISDKVAQLFPHKFWKQLISMHDGGIVGGSSGMPYSAISGASSAPNIAINVINQDSGLPPVNIQMGAVKQQVGQISLDAYIEAKTRNRSFRRMDNGGM